jgi:hypothetical protein
MVELSTTHLDSFKEVQAFRLFSHTLDPKFKHPFGTRYFSNMLIYMHPHILRDLSDLSSTSRAKYVQVLGIQLPSTMHTALQAGSVDPMHDFTAPGNYISRSPYGEVHNDPTRPVKTLVKLIRTRMVADITTLRQALRRMPKL